MNPIDRLTKLLNQTKDDCPECHGTGHHTYESTTLSTYEDTCLTCSGTGKVGDWYFDRLVVLEEDQELPPLITNIEDWTSEDAERESRHRMLKAGFRRVREFKNG